MSGIASVATASPKHEVSRILMLDIGREWLKGAAIESDRLERMILNAGVENRYFALPHEQILALNGMQHRTALFEELGKDLLGQAVETAFQQSDVKPADIGHLVFTSCSAPVIPSIDVSLIFQAALPNTVKRIPIYQHGCAGGVVGLSLGAQLAQLGKPVLVTSLELCSLVFQPQNHAGAQLVGASIFADGAAATIITPDVSRINVVSSQSYLIPNTQHLMGYDVFDDGFHLRLDKALPRVLIEKAPHSVGNFLEQNSLSVKDIDYWLFHPGGIKILNFLEETFGLAPEQCCWSRDVLRDFGNLSSATIWFVLQRFLESESFIKNKNVLMLGIGPGLTVETILIRT